MWPTFLPCIQRSNFCNMICLGVWFDVESAALSIPNKRKEGILVAVCDDDVFGRGEGRAEIFPF